MRPDAVVGSRPGQLPLPSGPNGLPRARVTEIQRTRLIAAIVATVDELGYQRATVAEVIIRARVSRKTFYEIFADLEDCFLAAFDDALAQASVLASEAYAQAPGWRHGTRAALGRLLAAIDEQPTLARLCMLETLVAGARVRARRAAVLVQLASARRPRRRCSRKVEAPAVAHGCRRRGRSLGRPASAPGGRRRSAGERTAGATDEHDRAALPRHTSCASRTGQARFARCTHETRPTDRRAHRPPRRVEHAPHLPDDPRARRDRRPARSEQPRHRRIC